MPKNDKWYLFCGRQLTTVLLSPIKIFNYRLIVLLLQMKVLQSSMANTLLAPV